MTAINRYVIKRKYFTTSRKQRQMKLSVITSQYQFGYRFSTPFNEGQTCTRRYGRFRTRCNVHETNHIVVHYMYPKRVHEDIHSFVHASTWSVHATYVSLALLVNMCSTHFPTQKPPPSSTSTMTTSSSSIHH